MFQRLIRLGLAAALTIAAVAAATPTHAQFTQNGNAYYTTADHTLNTDISGNDVFVGKDPGTFATLPGTVTLTVDTGATTTGFGPPYPDGDYYFGLYALGNHRVNIIGGSVSNAYGYNNSTMNITGGSVNNAAGFDNSTVNISGGSIDFADSVGSSTMNITGGNVSNTISGHTSTMNITGGNIGNTLGFYTGTLNISGGSIYTAGGLENSTTNISGGTLQNGFMLHEPGATANFLGTGLSFAYQPYGASPYGYYADFFRVSGTFQGEARTYDLYIRNPAGAGGTPNSTQRQFNLVVVPEAGTFALALPALGIIGVVIAKRRKK